MSVSVCKHCTTVDMITAISAAPAYSHLIHIEFTESAEKELLYSCKHPIFCNSTKIIWPFFDVFKIQLLAQCEHSMLSSPTEEILFNRNSVS